MSISKEIISELSEKDMQIYLHGGYVKTIAPGTKDWQWCRWNEAMKEDGVVKIQLSGIEDTYTGCLDDFEFDFTLPKRGYYRATYSRQPMPIYVYRRMDKQYHKLFHSHSMSMEILLYSLFARLPYSVQVRDEIQGKLPKTRLWSNGMLNDLFLSEVQHDIKEELDLILSKKILCIDLDYKFCVSQGINTDIPDVWFHMNRIGSLKSATEVRMFSKLFYQEAVDFFTPKGIEVNL